MKQDNMIFINGCPLNVIDEIPDKLEIPVDKNSQQQHFQGGTFTSQSTTTLPRNTELLCEFDQSMHDYIKGLLTTLSDAECQFPAFTRKAMPLVSLGPNLIVSGNVIRTMIVTLVWR